MKTVRHSLCMMATAFSALPTSSFEEWAEDAVQSGEREPNYEQRSEEWKAMRPLLVALPALLRRMLAIREAKLKRIPLDLASRVAEAAIATINDTEFQQRILASTTPEPLAHHDVSSK